MKVEVTSHAFDSVSPEGSWLNYWLRHSEADCRTPYCAAAGCPEPPITGVTVRCNEQLYVVPACAKHAIAGRQVELYDYEPLADYPEK